MTSYYYNTLDYKYLARPSAVYLEHLIGVRVVGVQAPELQLGVPVQSTWCTLNYTPLYCTEGIALGTEYLV